MKNKTYASVLLKDFKEKKIYSQLINFVKDQTIINYGSLYWITILIK